MVSSVQSQGGKVFSFSCQGRSVGNAFDIDSAEECFDICIDTDGCVWATHFSEDDFCALTLDCPSVEFCGDCTIASVNNNNCEVGNGDAAEGDCSILVKRQKSLH